MKKNALVAFGLLISLVPAGTILGKEISQVSSFAVVKKASITMEQARKNALKRVAGQVEDEYSIEDEDGSVTTYVFIIKSANGKTYEVQIDAANGNVLSADEQVMYEGEDSEDTPPADETPMVSDEMTNTEEPEPTEPVEDVEVEQPPVTIR